MYRISGGQLAVLWIFGLLLTAGCFFVIEQFNSFAAFFLMLFSPFFLIFYSIGWKNFRKTL